MLAILLLQLWLWVFVVGATNIYRERFTNPCVHKNDYRFKQNPPIENPTLQQVFEICFLFTFDESNVQQ